MREAVFGVEFVGGTNDEVLYPEMREESSKGDQTLSEQQDLERATVNALREAEEDRKQRAADYIQQSRSIDRDPEFEPLPTTKPKWKAGWDGNRCD